jgi:hypothetical protein
MRTILSEARVGKATRAWNALCYTTDEFFYAVKLLRIYVNDVQVQFCVARHLLDRARPG